ncbi:alpha/beta hydrolase [Variovorax sp. WS11]|uniref:alpha/beta fold hydrolase n=1 Tax=Variovorax sp. WS11 TaxID=1105204 RepID=UPI000D0DCD88|nr:alpha/beta hydrolase [Variovorax sp. WS11]NDZ13602.1 alpha/beta hydrolase [Variovorax sp. WS11]PSL81166.1 alpha/beta hydrolase [Variovorax sp. WS11]
MSKLPIARLVAIVFAFGFSILAGCALYARKQDPKTEIGFLQIDSDIKLRRMVVHNSKPKGVVLFLHGFPETVYAWKEIAPDLARDYEVHAFDWPGFGLSSRPPVDKFSYAPKDYARVLKAYIEKAGIDKSRLVIYATDIGSLPALLLALDDPNLAKSMIVGDFAPFNRPQYMQDNLQNLKSKPSSDLVRAALNKNRDEILENAFRRGLPKDEQFDLPQEFKDDMLRGWNQGDMTSADAFYHYYSNFTRDQDYFELNLARLKTPVKLIWGEKDFYIDKQMGVEFAKKASLEFHLLPDLGHYPHLQSPRRTIEEVRAAFGSR